jgi:dihydropteroate synthase
MRITPISIKNQKQAKQAMQDLGVDAYGIKIMAPKMVNYSFKIENIDSIAANIIKQHLLSLGADAALSRDTLVKSGTTSIFIFGTEAQIKQLITKLKQQDFGLKKIAAELKILMQNKDKRQRLKIRGRSVLLRSPFICGVLNVTPDSFSGDGLLGHEVTVNSSNFKKLVINKANAMIKAGAKMIDVGGESTRPYAQPVTVKEELQRVIPVIKSLRKKFPKVLLSVDTYKYEVAKAATDEGVDIVNDITAGRKNPKIMDLIAKHDLGYIIMHMQGNPRNMQDKPLYDNVVADILDFFQQRIDKCHQRGISSEQVMLDPGIGFGKTLEQNYILLNNLFTFKKFRLPLFVGVSRKSFIGKFLNISAGQRLPGTIAAIILSYLRGGDIFRVHDVTQVNQALRVFIKGEDSWNYH